MSNSVQPHRWQPTRLPRPWDSPGKNTGVGCHFLLQCMKVKSESEVPQSCRTLSDPIDSSLPVSFAHGVFQARVLEWVAIAFSSFGASGHISSNRNPALQTLNVTEAEVTLLNSIISSPLHYIFQDTKIAELSAYQSPQRCKNKIKGE